MFNVLLFVGVFQIFFLCLCREKRENFDFFVGATSPNKSSGFASLSPLPKMLFFCSVSDSFNFSISDKIFSTCAGSRAKHEK